MTDNNEARGTDRLAAAFDARHGTGHEDRPTTPERGTSVADALDPDTGQALARLVAQMKESNR